MVTSTIEHSGTWEQVVAAYHRGAVDVDYLPRVLCVEPTNVCNFACTSCVRPEGKGHMLDVDELVEWVTREPEPFRAAPVWVHFSGESLLHPNLAGIMRVLREHGARIMLSTNASRLDDRRCDMLLESGLELVVFSLDAARRETFASIRIGGDFDRVQDNVRRFIAKRPADALPITQAQLVLSSQSLAEIHEFMVRWAEEGIDTIQLKRYSTRGGVLPVPMARRDDAGVSAQRPCLDPWLNVIVRADGSVVPCCADFTGRLVLGSLHENSLAEIWNGQAAMNLRKAHATGENLPEICRQCTDARTPDVRESVVRCEGLPADEDELRQLLTDYPRHLMFDVREEGKRLHAMR